ncbi:MAG: hypothetical protein M3494_06485 [Actinomycetota bacterium]|jgi:hypothetical protein|nr:hypothetical protein [Rubrobacter sp.]MDQ3507645.1 hypothetical protein [Actinomycetota bacterium]
MDGKIRKQFCEVEQAARIIGVEKRKIEGWLDGGMLTGTYSKGRWLADIHAVCRLHARFVRDGRIGSRTFLAACERSKLCDRISESNERMLTDMHSPRRSKTEEKLIALIDEISVIATPGQFPEKPKKPKRCAPARPSKAATKTRQEERKESQAKNVRAYESFRKHRAERFGDEPLPSIANKRYWWNDED